MDIKFFVTRKLGVWFVRAENEDDDTLGTHETKHFAEICDFMWDQLDQLPVQEQRGYEDNYTDAEADADTLKSAGMGTDEDYGMFDSGEPQSHGYVDQD
jgi:hypothetical protein